MPYNRNITADDKVFFDTDNILRFTIYVGNPTDAEIVAGTAVIQNVAGMDLIWTLKKKAKNEESLIEKTIGSGITVTGVFNASPGINTQRVDVAIDDTDTYDASADPIVDVKPGTYDHALKRLDPGEETILTWGTFVLLQAAAWE